ncbi:hypothetical protein JL101_022500 [Skermanella rosea]|uniref:hypothetical protein n=1 Tax=Skermanella rosea TaxID=1817965 RepID=UPI0019336B26|nr:hypothetical protein [Skermanella rosea]UEM02723.1 hypothetical protein JL101_022500 [Skermanella rosea]
MAESQELFHYTGQMHSDLDAAISPSRLAPYLVAVGGSDRDMAMKLYLWNARIAKSFLYPLHVAEVITRNAMHEAFSSNFGGPGWMDPASGRLYKRLNIQPQAAIQKAISRLAANGNIHPSPDDIVAALTFDFWSNLFRRDYSWLWPLPDRVSGKSILETVFPNLPAGKGRGYVKDRVAAINDFRNRVAHHEPVHYRHINHKQVHDRILEFIGFRCTSTRAWVSRHSTVPAVIRTAPTPEANLPGKLLTTVKFVAPTVVSLTDTLALALGVVRSARPPLALVPDPTATPPYRLLTPTMLLEYFSVKATEDGGLVDVTASTVADVVAATPAVLIDTVDVGVSTGDLSAKFFPAGSTPASRPQALLVTNSTGTLLGVVTRPDFRY